MAEPTLTQVFGTSAAISGSNVLTVDLTELMGIDAAANAPSAEAIAVAVLESLNTHQDTAATAEVTVSVINPDVITRGDGLATRHRRTLTVYAAAPALNPVTL